MKNNLKDQTLLFPNDPGIYKFFNDEEILYIGKAKNLKKRINQKTRSNMTEQEVIYKVCDRLVTTLYNELDYYMFEELGYTETDEKYVEDADKLLVKIIKELTE